MILVDTSVWIDHLRSTNQRLADLLNTSQVLIHPFVIGELALGTLRQRATILAALHDLPRAIEATDAEVLHLIDTTALHGRGIGYIDAHLLAATRLTPSCKLWSRDKRLAALAAARGLAASP